MTKRDYKILALALNRRECENRVNPFTKESEQLARHQVHPQTVKRIIEALKVDNPKFDSIKFLETIEQ